MTSVAHIGSSPLTPPRTRTVIVNADDFGRSRGINRGVLEAYDNGIVTSASLMTMWPASIEAAQGALERPDLSVGLHVDLGEWVYRGGAWEPRYVRAALDDGRAIEAEVARQLRVFQRMLGADPTHIDSHQHVHLRPAVWPIVCKLADTLDVPLRHRGGLVRYCGSFYGHSYPVEPALDRLTPDALKATLASLDVGLTELVCHPGYAVDVASSYGPQREIEVRTLCDASIRATLADEGIVLGSFRSLASSNGQGGTRIVLEPPPSNAAPPRSPESIVDLWPAPAAARDDSEVVSPELVLVDSTLGPWTTANARHGPLNDGPRA